MAILYKFPLVPGASVVVEHIFPTQQLAAQAAIHLAEKDIRIKRLIVFGSALTMNCGIDSDLDLAIDSTATDEDEFVAIAHPFFHEIETEVDIIDWNNINSDFLLDEIKQKGYVLWHHKPTQD